MPHASHRIDLLVLPVDPEQPLPEGPMARLLSEWGVDDRGRVDNPEVLLEGGCRRVWIDRPGRVWLYGNQRGGFRVQCPETGHNIAQEFGAAHRAWKGGGPRSMRCPSCGGVHALERVEFVPPAAFATWALVFSDAGSSTLSAAALAQIDGMLGPTQCIIRRP